MLRMDSIMDCLIEVTYIFKIDLRSGYYHIKIIEGNEWKTIFKTMEALYEWRVMPFGLTSVPNTFMHLMTIVIKTLIRKSVVVYLDDILVFSNSKDEHMVHLRWVLDILSRDKLYVNLEKCNFF